ncbi:MAG: carboxylesterase family protein [Clostridium perfringens]|nr:carboxylesterase family protein [Clostridium perfringens]
MIVSTKLGLIEGVFENNQYVFKGIPYGEAPIGEKRFNKVEPKKPWEGVLNCKEFSKICVQNVEDKETISEDSLTINIWTKSVDAPKKAVVLWIHGGGFTRGTGSDEKQSGINFADDNIVYVSLNYRLGVLGFLDLESILGKEYKSSGNNGILDIIEGLKWIKENIEFFGGDKDNITVMGESAGAKCIGALLVSPLAKGLFNKAILESGSFQAIRDKNTAKKVTERFLKVLEINKNNKEKLFSLSCREILDAQNKMSNSEIGNLQIFGPVVDGEVFPYEPIEAINKGAGSKVSLLIGTNLKEANLYLFFSEDLRNKKEECIKDIFGENYKNVFESYNRCKTCDDDGDSWQRVLTNYLYKLYSYRLANEFARLGEDVYLYRFDWSGNIGPCHGQELPFVFKVTGSEPVLFNLKEEDLPLGEKMNMYWKNFIQRGNPNGDSLTYWEKFTEDNRSLIIFNKEIKKEILNDNWDDKLCINQGFIL